MESISINNKFLDFKEIKEIKFTRVGTNTYSISIQSDIEINNKTLENSLFESQLCTLDSAIELRLQDEYTLACLGDKVLSRKCFNIPLNIKLLVDTKEEEFFKITTMDSTEN